MLANRFGYQTADYMQYHVARKVRFGEVVYARILCGTERKHMLISRRVLWHDTILIPALPAG